MINHRPKTIVMVIVIISVNHESRKDFLLFESVPNQTL